MCTAITYRAGDYYFGRNLDLEYSYNETVTITPRNFPLSFRYASTLSDHYAFIGMAYVQDGYPLYYDAANEKGLSMAGLNFPDYAEYQHIIAGFDNIAPFEFIPWVLGQCETLEQVKILLSRTNLIAEDFSSNLPVTPLHWIISDSKSSITVEPVREGLKIYDNPAEVLTNSPPFNIHMWNLNNYMNLSAEDPSDTFSPALKLNHYSRGMGGIGLPGDFSSASRFVRAAFMLGNAAVHDTEASRVNHFFRMLANVAMPKGCVYYNGKVDYTIYSSCCNASRGIYYYTTYDNSRITAVDMHLENLDSSELISLPLAAGSDFLVQNSGNKKADA